jgi:hypothetical protein
MRMKSQTHVTFVLDSSGSMSKIALDMAHDGDGAEAAHKSVSESISRARNQGTTDGFNQKDRQRQERTED